MKRDEILDRFATWLKGAQASEIDFGTNDTPLLAADVAEALEGFQREIEGLHLLTLGT